MKKSYIEYEVGFSVDEDTYNRIKRVIKMMEDDDFMNGKMTNGTPHEDVVLNILDRYIQLFRGYISDIENLAKFKNRYMTITPSGGNTITVFIFDADKASENDRKRLKLEVNDDCKIPYIEVE